ncbi:hypothetical protein ED312_18950 [Sinomicrobium pectinilyticum]|uniref:POTRA domain-containing protein n=1 Tax=Sinomicrobium pectinilyticum TaxID=1084421 RepID=A0A3N0DZ24_SINP1|nr:hypothetical protein [Sinomicrobium pectinilyticum]RNL80746.1 hypothetical protein ED312_18950 [Sinomicrobium pectinilyticum]
MRKIFRFILLLVLISTAIPLPAQVSPVKQDSTGKKEKRLYQDIEDYSRKRGFTRFLHRLMFRPVDQKEKSEDREKILGQSPEMTVDYSRHSGKVIRNIAITTLDPFGYSIADTTRQPEKWIERAGNSIHLKTKDMTIKNLLLFKKGQELDSLLIEESERLIRRQRFVRRVIIIPVDVPGNPDMVDLQIRVLDSWSLTPGGSASSSRTSFELTERNFFGLGHEFRNEFEKKLNTGETSYLGRYTVPNILNTYVQAQLNYEIQKGENVRKSFGLNRDFFSAYTKWAGGIYIEENLVRDSLPDAQGVYAMQNMKSEALDVWGGYSFRVSKGNTEADRTTGLITTLRYFNRNYKEVPSVLYDSVGFFSDEKLFLASVGISSRKFEQDKFLFNYDIVEDVPIGRTYGITFGARNKNDSNQFYLGGKYAFGNYYKWGYFSVNAEIGSFYYHNRRLQSALRLDGLYFSNIKPLGNWYLRHFVQPVLVLGDRRMAIIADRVDINGENGISGFDSEILFGTKKFTLTYQLQAYAPWNVAGFRLNPFFNVSMGFIGDEKSSLFDNNIYSKIGIGLLINNDYLVFNNFRFSLAYYPSIPGQGYNVFKTNSISNDDFMLPDFQIGKPGVIPYE